MRPIRLILLPALLPLLASCGMTARPVVRNSSPPPEVRLPEASDPGGRLEPHYESSITRRVCRAGPRPRGWISISYEQDRSACPTPVDADNPYTVALMMKYADQPIGTRLVVCADESVPSGWIRLNEGGEGRQCNGARVAAGNPMVKVILRNW